MNNTNQPAILFLIADNDPVLARVIRNKFEKEMGWQSFIVSTYQDALETITHKKPSAVMTEIIIKDDSGKTGFDLIAEIKSQNQNIPIIVFSDLGQAEDREKAMKAGATHYFSKNDVSIVQLMDEVKKILK
jgi:two-component system repressor protein LuxO